MNKPLQREKVSIQYYVYCPICNREIVGTSPKQISYNLKLHMEGKECQKK